MKRLFLPIMLLFALISGTVKAQTLTVCDGTLTNKYVPFYGYWGDMGDGPSGEMIYPASMVSDMAGKDITSMTFYSTRSSEYSFSQNITVMMGTTTNAGFLEWADHIEDGLTQVYQGAVTMTGGNVVLTFDTPFTYSGDNLVVFVHLAKGGYWSSSDAFYGAETEAYNSTYGYGSGYSYSGVVDFLPKTTFTYEGGGGGDLPEPTDVPNEYFYISASGWAIWTAAPASYPEGEDECVIDAVNLVGFVEPFDGDNPSYNVTVNGNDCTIGYMDWNSDNGMMDETDIFSFGGTYYMYFEVEPEGDCTFADNVTVTINGSESIVDNYGLTADGALWIYTIDYNLEETPDECVIETVAIYGFEEPVYGGTANTDGLYVESDQYEITYAAWYGYDAGELADGDIFGEDIYYLYVELTPTDGCEIGDLTFLVNDDENIPDLSYCGYDGGYGIFYVNSVDYELSPFPITFEDGTLGFLTTIDNDGDGYTFTPYQGGASYAHGGSWYARVRWNSSGNDDYLIIPVSPVDGDVLSFYAASENNSSYLETFSILVSTTTPEAASFTTTLSTHANIPNTWNEYTADLSDYAGQDIYVAIHCTSYDKFYLRIDDIDLTNAKKADVAKKGFKNLSGKQAIAHNSVNKTGLKAHKDGRTRLTPIYEFAKRSAWGVKANRSFTWDFDDSSLGDWTNIDADGDGYVWMIATETPGVYHESGLDISGNGHNGSYDFMTSASYSNATGEPITPDNYLVSPLLSITEDQKMFSFWASAQDGTYAAEHFGVAVSTTNNTDPEAFTMLEEWDMTAKSAAITVARKNVRGATREQTRQGNWYQYTIDLSDYIGQDVYVAIRHFDCTDMFMLNVDDITLASPDFFESYNLYLDGNLVAEGITDLDYYMQGAEEFSDGSSHTASVEAVYASGNKLAVTKAWTFQSGDHFTGAPNGLSVDVAGNNAALTWELPEMEPEMIDITYTFDDGYYDGLYLIDANGDGNYWGITNSYGVDGSACAYIPYASPSNDDYLVLPAVTATENTVFSFDAASFSSTYGLESFEAVLSLTGNESADNFTIVLGSDDAVPVSYQNYSYSLGEYAGQEVYVAIRNTSPDVMYFLVDNISITNAEIARSAIGAVVYRDGEIIAKLRDGDTSYNDTFEGDVPTYCISIIQNGAMSDGVYYALAEKQCVENVEPCVAPENVTTTVDGTDVIVAWDGEAESYTLRYKVHSDAPYTLFDFEDGIDEFITIDGDGDGFDWYSHINTGQLNHTTHSGDGVASSNSYDKDSSTALHPSNWLITPMVTLGGTLSLWYVGQDPSWADEHFEVLVSTTGTDTTDFVQISNEIVATGEYQQFTASLAAYEGMQGYVAIHHFNVTDMFILNIDDIEIGNADGLTEWIVVEGITANEYTINNLLPNTLYDVEVEAFCGTAQGQFTTGEADPCVAPINLVIEAYGAYNNVILVWDFEDGVVPVGCNIYRSTDGVSYELIAQTENNDASYLDEGLEPGTYYYQVTALNTLPDGTECESAPVETTVEIAEPGTCETPINLTATVNGDDVTLTWEMPGVDPTEPLHFDFEGTSEDEAFQGWTTIDADGDGRAWYWLDSIQNNLEFNSSHNGGTGFLTSASYQSVALTPDNYLVSPQITVSNDNKIMTFWSCAQDPSWPSEHFGVAVSTTSNTDANAFTMLEEWDMTAKNLLPRELRPARGSNAKIGGWYQYTVDLSAYMGQSIYVAIRHFDCTDWFRLNVDDITFASSAAKDGGDVTYNIYRSEDGVDYELIAEGVTDLSFLDEDLDYGTYYYQVVAVTDVCISDPAEVEATIVEPSACVAPINLAATLNGDDVTLTWEMPGQGGDDPTNLVYDFEDDFTAGAILDWTTIDADGDGYDWYIRPAGLSSLGHNDSEGFVTSASYMSVALTPDNYLVSPQITVSNDNKVMTFWACAQDPSWPVEHFGVAVSTTSNTDASAFTMLDEWDMTAKNLLPRELRPARGSNTKTGAWYQYTVDLSAYMGQSIYVAIRHFDCTDMFRLNVDDIAFASSAAKDGGDVTFNIYRSEDGVDYELIAEGVTDLTYLDEDLDFGTYYYQVVAISTLEDGTECEEYAIAVNGVDNFVMVEIEEVIEECAVATNLDATVEGDGNNVTLTWNAPVSGETSDVIYDFEATTVAEGLQGWTNIDADGDGEVWEWVGYGVNQTQYANSAYEGIGYASSASYNGSPLSPDNYLVSPQFTATASTAISFYAEGQDPSYVAEHFGIAVSTTGNTNAADFEMVSQEYVAVNPWQLYTVDLSAYAGQEIYVAFRHFNCTDMFQFNIDYVTITGVAESAGGDYLYDVYRSTDGENYELIAEGITETSYYDGDLGDGTYYYQVVTTSTLSDGTECAEYAIAVNGDDYVMVTLDGIVENDNLISVYPNPTKNNVNIEAEGLNNIVVFNALGQAVYEVRATDDHVVVNMSNFGAGVYMFNIITNNGTTVKRVTVVK